MQGVMEGLGDFIEVVAAGDDFPADGEPQLLKDGDQPVEHFGHASSHGRGVHHLHRAHLKPGSQGPQFGDFRFSEHRSVIVQTD